MVKRTSNRGFTLIELLTVIIIITILATFGVVGFQVLKRQTIDAKTLATMAAIQAALSEGAGGGVVAHPLAGTALVGTGNERPLFYGSRNGSTLALSTNEAAIRVSEAEAPTALASRLVLDNDRLADPLTPHLFGLQRQQLYILGSSAHLVTGYFTNIDGTNPSDWYEPEMIRFKFGGSQEIDLKPTLSDASQEEWENLSDRAIKASIGETLENAGALDAVLRPDVSDPLARDDRMRVDTDSERARKIKTGTRWAPGRIQDTDGSWKPMLIRGTALYDHWGTEFLIYQSGNDWVILSAGPDGTFHTDPGGNGIINTSNPFAGWDGDDTDGSLDNLQVGGQQ